MTRPRPWILLLLAVMASAGSCTAQAPAPGTTPPPSTPVASAPVPGATAPGRAAEPLSSSRVFVGHVWRDTNPVAAAGTLRVFLPDGTLVMTSCVETYRLGRWTPVDDRRIRWQEDTAAIEAEVVRATASELHLRLHLAGEIKDERYIAATVPFVCPDLRTAATTNR